MDLLATVRKEGSRGGRGEFKWTDVQNSSHRENYLGHSLMAPVGRWQKGKDLNWYAKAETEGDNEDAAQKAARERKEELRRVKEAEQDAMARALGLPIPDRNNANLEAISDKRDFDKVMKEAVSEGATIGAKGVGFGGTTMGAQSTQVLGERIDGNAEAQDRELHDALKEYKRRHGDGDRRHRSRSRERERRHRKRDRSRELRDDGKHEHSSSIRDRHRRRRSRSRSRSRDRRNRDRRRERSRSPYKRDNDRSEHRRRRD